MCNEGTTVSGTIPTGPSSNITWEANPAETAGAAVAAATEAPTQAQQTVDAADAFAHQVLEAANYILTISPPLLCTIEGEPGGPIFGACPIWDPRFFADQVALVVLQQLPGVGVGGPIINPNPPLFHIDIGGSFFLPTGIGGVAGVEIEFPAGDSHFYIGGGLGSPGLGGQILVGPGGANPGVDVEVTGGWYVGGEFEFHAQGAQNWELGVVSPGGNVVIVHTW